MSATIKNADREAIRNFKKVLQRFNQFDTKMQVSTILTLLEVIEADLTGTVLSPTDIEDKVGLKPGTATRNIYYWGEGHKQMSGSYGLVDVALSIEDRRRRELTLTHKGKAFAHHLIEELKDGKATG